MYGGSEAWLFIFRESRKGSLWPSGSEYWLEKHLPSSALQQPSAVSCVCSPRCGRWGGDGGKDMEDPVGKAFLGQPGRDTPHFGPMTDVHSQELLPVLCSREESCWNPCAAAFSCQGEWRGRLLVCVLISAQAFSLAP